MTDGPQGMCGHRLATLKLALCTSAIHAATSIGIGFTVFIVATGSDQPPWVGWMVLAHTFARALTTYPYTLYAVAGLFAVLLVPLRAGLADTCTEIRGRPQGTGRQVVSALATAVGAALLYLALSALLNDVLAPEFRGRRFNDVEAVAIGLWAVSAVPVTMITSYVIRQRLHRSPPD